MTEPTGINLWGCPKKQQGKRHKPDIIRDIAKTRNIKSLDIYLLSIKDLEYILSIARTDLRVPRENIVGKLKRPYMTAIQNILPDADVQKLTVDSMKQLLEVFYESR